MAAWLWVLPVAVFVYFSVVRPWPVAEVALAALGPGPRVVVGMTFEGSVTDHHSRRSQIFLVPASFRSLAAYEVTEDGPSVLVETVPFGLLIFGGFYGTWIAVSLWFLAGARNGR